MSMLLPGNQHTSKHFAPGRWALLYWIARSVAVLLRGDCGFGNEPIMREAEQRGLAYLFNWIDRQCQADDPRLATQREWTNAGKAGKPRRACYGSMVGAAAPRDPSRRRVKGALTRSMAGQQPLSSRRSRRGCTSTYIPFSPLRSTRRAVSSASRIAIAAIARIFSTS